jgi:HlyD family secretion protein
MSASPQLVPRPPAQPGPRIADRPGHKPPRWQPRGLWLVVMSIVIAAVGLWSITRIRPAVNQTGSADLRVARATDGTSTATVRVSGTTAAKNFVTITAPMMRGPDSGRQLVLTKLVSNGSYVKQGEIVAEIDAQAIKDHVDDIHAQVVQADTDVKKRQAEQAIELENLQQNLRVAKANAEKARLDAGASAIRSDIDQEELKLGVEEAEATYKELQSEITLTKQKFASEIRVLEYTRERHTRHRDRHRHDVTLFTIHANMNGLALMESIWRGGDMGQVQEGDQISPGQPFMKIVDPRSMLLQTSLNQAESDGVRIGQLAEIHLDAFPGLTLSGRVASIGAMGVGGWREQQYIRNIPVRIAILEQDSRVIPDLSGSANISLTKPASGLVIPIEALHQENGKSYVLVKSGAETQRKEVELGLRTHTQAVITGGLNAGEEVVLNR